MEKDIKRLYNNCVEGQQSQIGRHVVNNPSHFMAPDGPFDHFDIIRPLPSSETFSYCLTMIDRFSRWVEAIPIREITTQTIARAFFDSWVSRFGCPKIITTNQGAQFESLLFTAICSLVRKNSNHRLSSGR